MRKRDLLALMAILTLGLVLRFYRLGEIPPSFHRDEAFLGYNAYSILKTGRDINGNFFPLHLQSFLYSPAGYCYFSAPFIWLFGLNSFAVRFSSAFFGSLTILITYFLVKELFKNSKFTIPYSLFTILLLSLSPWHLDLSRAATENVIVVFFISLGVLLYLIWARKKQLILLLASFFAFGVTLALYQAPRAFLPLFIPILIIASHLRTKVALKNRAISWGLFFLFIVAPLFLILRSEDLSLRIRTVSIFSTQETQLLINQQIREDGISSIPVHLSRFFHNKPAGYLTQFLKNYFAHFSFDFLFTDSGFPDRYRVPLVGLLYLFELPLLLIGTWYLLKLKGKEGLILFSWVLLSPVGSALTFDDVPNLQRTLIVFPALSIILACGLLQVIMWLNKKKPLILLVLPITLLAFYNIFFYLHQYYVHFPLYRPWYRNDGYEDLVKKVNELLPDYKKAVITNYESAPTIFFLFFGQYEPVIFQKETARPAIKDFGRINFGKYEFSEEQCPLRLITNKAGRSFVNGEEGVLYVNSGLCKLPAKNVRELGQVRRKDNSLVFQILEYRK